MYFLHAQQLYIQRPRERLPTLQKTWWPANGMVTTAMPFFASLVTCFPTALGFSDCVYDEISIVPTKLIPNPGSKSLLEKSYEVSNFPFLGCSAGSPHQSVRPSSIFSTILNNLPLSDFDETCYIDTFWDEICDVCLFTITSHHKSPSPPFPQTFPSRYGRFPIVWFWWIDETCYIYSFLDAICDVCTFIFEVPPLNSTPSPSPPSPIVRFGYNLECRFILWWNFFWNIIRYQ